MARIIAGTLETHDKALRVMETLRAAGIPPDHMTTFYVAPPGQHGAFPIGGDAYSDAGAKQVGEGSLKGAATGAAVGAGGGAAIATAAALAGAIPIAAPVILAAAAAIGAYIGSLQGGMRLAHDDHDEPATDDCQPSRHAGALVAVYIDDATREQEVIDVLRNHGAMDLECEEGEWRDGQWVDFDAVKPLHPISGSGLPR